MTKQNRTKLLIDLLAFVAFLFTMDPRSSGIPVHEWLTIAVTGVIIVHLLLNWSWIVDVTKRLFIKSTNGSRLNYVLNWLLFIDGVLIMLSGIMISQSVMPFFGATMPESFTWRELHDMSANLFLIILGIHLALHWNWIIVNTKRLLTRKGSRSISIKGTLEKDAQS
jgi:cytochrome b561